jgi:Cu(I)/Ag(I) efflux system membrane fusion protein
MEKPNPSTAKRQLQAVIKKYWHVPTVLLILAVLFLAGSWYGQRKVDTQKAAGSRRILYYVDPMNPGHTSPEPGLAPCGMKMEPVYAEDGGQSPGSAMPPGSVKITPEKQQIIGVRVATVEKSPWTFTLRTVGKVAVDETRIYRLNAFVEGWVVKIFNNTTGSLVRKDEPLATVYNRDLPTTLQTFYYALGAVDRMNQNPHLLPSQHDLLVAQKLSAEGVLMNLGMGKPQRDELARSRKLTQEIIISAPATSFILARNITPGQRFGAGEELYRLADLSQVWVLADLFENEAKYIRPGEKVRVTLPKQDEKRVATVSEVLPEFDTTTLTLKVRLEMDNPQFALRPGMFVDVEFPINMPPTVNVPVDAIMDSGLKQTMFVDRGNGYFEPRRVKTGWRLGDRVEIVEGLEPGERIVVSGNFLIDSESRMKLAAAGMFGVVTKDPVCGLNVDESKAQAAGFQGAYKNQTYYFCSAGCQQHFEKNPERYAAKLGGIQKTASGATGDQGHDAKAVKAKDPVCGHEVGETQAKAAGLTSDYEGKTYYFCSYNCNKQFDTDPARYLHQEGQAGGSVSQTAVAGKTAKDPVCSLPVAMGPAKQAGRTSEYQEKTYYFDTDGCKQRFDQDPQRYLSGSSGATPVEIQPYPNVPLEPDTLLQYKRSLMRMTPQEPAAATPQGATPIAPQGPTPAVPQGPAAETPPGATPATPPGATPATPPGPTPVVPQGPQVKPQTPPIPPAPSQPQPLSPPGGGGHRHD